ncbi:hypothetical protein VA596_20865 [Amycolatopsis sp., V23-08]|uniref:DUF4878 domain-containing protein n=2 Tax=Amycolatopsis heterodermiae TaxID=3110235 RepID=A0ABU5R8L6_9PSEU|nr:hypothetical protein [Amycolatopsis sp., V23-08]MEA5361999.1 hypothetical protein [Amycolatopsis sp., V23-08]
MDPAQLEQFRQFQQFQDYLRFTQAQQGNEPAPPQGAGQVQQYAGGYPPVPPGPPHDLVPAERRRRPAPKWLTWLGKKVIAWVLAFVVLAVAGTWLYNHFFPNDAGKTSEQLAQEGGGTYHTNHILSTSPYEAVREVYDAVAQNLVPQACGRMDEPIQQKFAQDMGYADCQVAVHELNRQVKSKNDYAESMPSYVSEPLPGDSFTISSCKFGIRGGPALGAFTVQKVEKNQWLIVGHTNEQTPCPAPTPTTR